MNVLNGEVTRIEFPRHTSTNTNTDNCHYGLFNQSALHSAPTLDGEGHLRILLTHGEEWGSPDNFASCGYASGTTALTLSQLTVNSGGGLSMQTLKQSTTGALGEPFWPTLVVANQTGAVAFDTEESYGNEGELQSPPAMALQLTTTGSAEITLPVAVTVDAQLAIGRDNTAYAANENGITRFDAATGELVWQSAVSGQIVNVRDDGGVVLWSDSEVGGTLTVLDQNGATAESHTLPIRVERYWGAGLWHGMMGGVFGAVYGASFVESTYLLAGQPTPPRLPKMVHSIPSIRFLLRLLLLSRPRKRPAW